MKITNYSNSNFIAISEYEAIVIAGGKDEGAAWIIKGIGIGLGFISKLAWKALQAASDCIAEQGMNGEMIIHK